MTIPIVRRGIGGAHLEVVVGEPLAVRVTALGALPGPWTVTAVGPAGGQVPGTVAVVGDDLVIGWPTVSARMVGTRWELRQAGRARLAGQLVAAVPGRTLGSETVEVTVSDAQTIEVTVAAAEGGDIEHGGTVT